MTDYNAKARALAAAGKNTEKRLGKPTAPQAGHFSDETLLRADTKIHIPDYLKNIGSYKRILTRFWNLYFTGTMSDRDNLESVVYDVAFLAQGSEGYLWEDDQFRSLGFYRPNQSESDELTNVASGAVVEIQFLSDKMDQAAKEDYRKLMDSYTANHMKNFRDIVADLIKTFPSSSNITEEYLRFLKLSSFLALTLMRFAIKDEAQMTNAFLKKQYKVNLTSIAGWKATAPFAPPCSLCLSVCLAGLTKGSAFVSRMFTKLAARFVRAQSGESPDAVVSAFLSASVLTHTARNGLGLVQMVDVVGEITGLGWVDLMSSTMWNTTSDAWEKVADFFITQKAKDKPQYGYNWARIIHDGYFRGLSPKEHLFFASVLGAVVEQIQGPSVWEAEWAKNAVGYDDARILGMVIFARSRPALKTLTGADSAMEIVEEAKAMAAHMARENGHSNAAKTASWDES